MLRSFEGFWTTRIDELHQAFVPGRDAAVMDLVFDLVGAAVGAFVAAPIASR